MSTPAESDPNNMSTIISETGTPSSSSPATAATSPPNPTSTQHREFPLVYNPADRRQRRHPPGHHDENAGNSSDDASPPAPQAPRTVQTPSPHSQISSHTPGGGQESSASQHAGAQPLDASSTFQQRFSALESVSFAEAGVSRLSAVVEKTIERETVGGEGRKDDGSPDRFFVVDEATRVEGHNGARMEGQDGKRERSSEAENAPTMRREGTKEGDRERRMRELREGVLEEEGKL